MFEVTRTILKQLFKKPATNLFPASRAPESTLGLLDKVARGQAQLNPPLAAPDGYRGKIAYDRTNCTGCRQCVNVCPTRAIEYLTEEKKVKIFITRCCFCAQCVDVCPVHTLAMTGEFCLAAYDKYDPSLVITDSGELPGSIKRKPKEPEAPAKEPAAPAEQTT